MIDNQIYTTVELDKISSAILNSTSSQIAILDSDGIVLAFNMRWKIFRDEMEEHWSHPSLNDSILTSLQRPLSEGNDFALRLLLGIKEVLSGEKEVFETKYQPIQDPSKNYFHVTVTSLGSEEGAIIVYEDISAEVKNREYLRETKEKLDKHFQNSFYGILVVNNKNQITEANGTACEMLRVPYEKVLFSDISTFLSIDYNPAEIQKRINRNGNFLGEFEVRTTKNELIPVELSVTLFRNEKGETVTSWAFKNILQRKKTQQALEATTLQYKLLFNNTLEGMIIGEPTGQILKVNPAACDILGYKPDELEGKHRDIVFDLSSKINAEAIAKRSDKGSFIGEVEFTHKSGHKIPVEASSVIFKTEDGSKKTILNIRDISARKKAEIENKKNQQLLNQLFSNSPIGIVLVDADGKVQTVNQSFENLFGFSEDEITGKSLDQTIVPGNLDRHAEKLSKLSFTGDSFQTETIRAHKNGTEIPVLVGGVPVELDGEVIAIYGMYVDISERKALENQIIDLLEVEKRERIQMQDMFEESPSAIAMLEGEAHTYTFVNDKYLNLVGKRNLLGKTVQEEIPELAEQGFTRFLDDCYKSGETKYFNEEKIYFKSEDDDSENIHYLNFIYKPIHNDEGEVYGIFVQAIDVTEQVEARKIIEKSLNEKETLLNEVHHRVKNNLAIISGLLELEILDKKDEQVSEHLHSTQSRISTIAKIHELLYQNESLSHVSFKKYIESVLESAAYSSNSCKLVSSTDLIDVELNVNQAIPAGMLLNEVLDYLDYINKEELTGAEIDVVIKIDDSENFVNIELVSPDQNLFTFFHNDDPNSRLRKELIHVLTTQIHGKLDIANEPENTLAIRFAKRELKGPHSALGT